MDITKLNSNDLGSLSYDELRKLAKDNHVIEKKKVDIIAALQEIISRNDESSVIETKMDTESYSNENYDNGTSRKRPLEEEQVNTERKPKRSIANGKPTLKILIPNHMAGKLIGKGGSNINELESKHDAHIQVSPNKDFYPGTAEDRIVTISADVPEIVEFCKNMIENVLVDEPSDRQSSRIYDFKIVISNVAVGLVIGKGGSVIKVIQEESHANINIAKQEASPVLGERVVKICGSIEQQSAACSQIIERMSAEPMKMSNSNTKYGGGDSFGGGSMYSNSMNMGYTQQSPFGNQSRYPMDMNTTNYGTSCYEQQSRVKTTHMIQMEIPDNMVGFIVGKQGQTINEFQRTSGAKINFSAKDEFAPETINRILTIKGGKNEIETAFMLIDQKAAQVEIELNEQPFIKR